MAEHETNPRQEGAGGGLKKEDRPEPRADAADEDPVGRDVPPPNPRPGGIRTPRSPWMGGG